VLGVPLVLGAVTFMTGRAEWARSQRRRAAVSRCPARSIDTDLSMCPDELARDSLNVSIGRRVAGSPVLALG